VKHWHETAAILDRVARIVETGERAAIATVVRISGSAYRRPGAKFLVERDGKTSGGVSGGCLEADVREVALQLLREGPPRLLHYDTGSDEETVWGLGLGCEGAVDIFVQPVGAEFIRGPGARMRELLASGTAFGVAAPFAVTTVVKGPQLGEVEIAREDDLPKESRIEERGSDTVFVDVLSPPPVLVIFGAGDDAKPLSILAAEAGFEVTVVDHRRGYLTPERFPPPTRLVLRRSEEGISGLGPRHFAVVQTHALVHDREWLRALLSQPLAYLGLLGPRARKEEILRQLGSKETERVFAPVGLDLGAQGPEQVAVSIVAEMLAVGAGREPMHLRAKRGGIHDR
jgi:xanthine/CO dehydrogenase XdhC/CoxF family maturation factor